MNRTFHVLSLGAGVQSTALYLMLMRGEVTPQIDAAIFADTGDEPQAVYAHLAWLQTLGGPPILVRSKGQLSALLGRGGKNARGRQFVVIPAFTKGDDGRVGVIRRQCSKDFKIRVIGQAIRREICGLAPGRSLPRSTDIVQYIGISLDESPRADRIAANQTRRGWQVRFPLIERGWTRAHCVAYLADKVPHETPRSACVYCPYKSDAEWERTKANAADWAAAVGVDAKLRQFDPTLFVHRSCKPLDQVEFKPEPPQQRVLQLLMNWECVEGVCGV